MRRASHNPRVSPCELQREVIEETGKDGAVCSPDLRQQDTEACVAPRVLHGSLDHVVILWRVKRESQCYVLRICHSLRSYG